jgi:hypothetical protein
MEKASWWRRRGGISAAPPHTPICRKFRRSVAKSPALSRTLSISSRSLQIRREVCSSVAYSGDPSQSPCICRKVWTPVAESPALSRSPQIRRDLRRSRRKVPPSVAKFLDLSRSPGIRREVCSSVAMSRALSQTPQICRVVRRSGAKSPSPARRSFSVAILLDTERLRRHRDRRFRAA